MFSKITHYPLELLRAAVFWPKFSLTSFTMVSGLRRQGLSFQTVIDVGANVGQFAVAAAKIFPEAQIHSFEPNPPCVDQLRKNVSTLPKVKAYGVALGDKEGEIEFHINEHSHSSSVLPLAASHLEAFPSAREGSVIQVKVSTLDNQFENVELIHPVLLKLDVQGYELTVLQGGLNLLSQVDYVLLEASFKPMYQGEPVFIEIVKQMQVLGFEFLRPAGFLRSPATGEFLQMDALFQRCPK